MALPARGFAEWRNPRAQSRVTVPQGSQQFWVRWSWAGVMREAFHVFAGRIYKVGVIRYVDVPAEVSREIAAGAVNVAVQGTVEGMALRTTLVPRGRGCHRLAIHGEIRKKLRVDAGAVVEVALERDEEPREPVVPPALALTLRLAPRAQAEFRGMTTALRRQIVRFVTDVKQEATRERRARTMVRRLEERAEKKARRRQKSRR